MKIIAQHRSVNPSSELCFDVSKDSLNLFRQYEHGGQTFRLEDEVANATGAIEHILRRCAGIAEESGLEAVRVLVASTGGYERKLLNTARRLGHRTALISAEHVAAQDRRIERSQRAAFHLEKSHPGHTVPPAGSSRTGPKRYQLL